MSAPHDLSLCQRFLEAPVLSRIHFPTHHMELSDLIMFLITELGVGPRRPDWESVLDRIERSSR